MLNVQLEVVIEVVWDVCDIIMLVIIGEICEVIEDMLNVLDSGMLCVVECQDNGDWYVNQWVKKVVLFGFCIKDMELQFGGLQDYNWWDKVDSKFKGWGDN